jgi:hypothetical protein
VSKAKLTQPGKHSLSQQQTSDTRCILNLMSPLLLATADILSLISECRLLAHRVARWCGHDRFASKADM